jgi:hypothetical protein
MHMVPISLPHRRRSDAPINRGSTAVAGPDPVAAYYLFLGVLALASAVIR